mgnify:CR=1 FL=1
MLHKTKLPEEILPAEGKSFAASPKWETSSIYIAPRLEAQYKDRAIVKINLFSGISGQQKVRAAQCWQNSRQIQQNNISSSQISVKALIELLTLPPADRQLISTRQNNHRSCGIDNMLHVDKIAFMG